MENGKRNFIVEAEETEVPLSTGDETKHEDVQRHRGH